jgi:hypothetical protein
MPKIAQAIVDGRQNAPVDFYWHLGHLRAIYRVDCDMAKRANPALTPDGVHVNNLVI